MADYRYLVFPPGKQPTRDEINELQTYASLLQHHLAFGTDRKGQSLTIAFDGPLFAQALQKHTGFEALIRHWQMIGCQLTEHQGFIKDATALQPVATPQVAFRQHVAGANQELVAAKQLAAAEALGRAGLAMHQALSRHAVLRCLGTWFPYLLIAIGTVMVLGTFFYVSHRLETTNHEHRQETITRIADDPLRQDLQSESSATTEPEKLESE